ncbi:hypothetical protein M2284_003465 [Rhodococcus sp. LBL1]|nr:hypothetical protein [Rhodococcus sp. LBL1]MDH6685011.1 hypothetical protein [Rhodococcus sp. LBL2]
MTALELFLAAALAAQSVAWVVVDFRRWTDSD